MPTTPNYGFEYETPHTLPGITLTGGPSSASPILAQQVDAALISVFNTLNNAVEDLIDQVMTLQGQVSVLETLVPLRGTVTVTPDTSVSTAIYAANYNRGITHVDFTPGYFSSTPIVATSVQTTVPGVVIEAGATNVTSSGCDVYLARANTTDTVVQWIAIAQ